jgi:hypothetical protein
MAGLLTFTLDKKSGNDIADSFQSHKPGKSGGIR